MLCALMISLYHEQASCLQQPYQILSLLVDLDSLIANWRYAHLLLVQRQIGSKMGTAGTGGIAYLGKTCDYRYQVFIDLFNVASFLIPMEYLPKLSEKMKRPPLLRLKSYPSSGQENYFQRQMSR
ncbi:unnamed protein product [Didymodactylos carnosus]|uniref:Tryptophan 2,3-dioxygenase n=2 Tax=Didymodactylos carnosus TaxID=1234261 RepID=A0A815VAB3_9BILA|nr:unnamed protein product [Didymodactylos carnosus]CAF4391596.1 unnamed protein product [Didymodactylos carnosus]